MAFTALFAALKPRFRKFMVSNLRFSVLVGAVGSPLVRLRPGREGSGSRRFFATTRNLVALVADPAVLTSFDSDSRSRDDG